MVPGEGGGERCEGSDDLYCEVQPRLHGPSRYSGNLQPRVHRLQRGMFLVEIRRRSCSCRRGGGGGGGGGGFLEERRGEVFGRKENCHRSFAACVRRRFSLIIRSSRGQHQVHNSQNPFVIHSAKQEIATKQVLLESLISTVVEGPESPILYNLAGACSVLGSSFFIFSFGGP